jgi:phage terminase large subunit-like protein
MLNSREEWIEFTQTMVLGWPEFRKVEQRHFFKKLIKVPRQRGKKKAPKALP